jgi:hypothetical protein
VGGGGGFGASDNLISNPDFSEGGDYWNITDNNDPIPYAIVDGGLCVVIDATLSLAVVGWPLAPNDAVELDPTATYEFSYDAWADDAPVVTLEAKVGEAVDPYLEHFLDIGPLSADRTRHTHIFTPSSSAPSGVVFIAYHTFASNDDPVQICVDNVVLRRL